MPKIVRLHRTGGPEVLTLEDLPTRLPGPGEVRIRVAALGLNRAEVLFRAGRYLETPELPARIGYEAAGTVDAIGDGVEGFAPGDAVSVIPSFPMSRYGVYGEEAVVPARALAHTPAGLSAIEAAALWMQYLTAYGALVDIAGVTAGDSVIIPAASSSVGLAAIQIVNGLGAVSIATTRSGTKKDALLQAGAHHVIVTERDDLVAEVMRITGGTGARIVFDPVAGPFVETLAQATAHGGTLFLYGILSMQPTPFPLFRALSHALTFRGYTLFEIVSQPERLDRGKAFVAEGLASGTLKPIIAGTFPLARIADAHRAMEASEHFGKIVVTV